MKALSKLASPAGFALVLLLFLFLPFLSVSCDVPGMGSIGADYSGAQLAVGDEPDVEIPAELRDMADELPGGGGENSEPPPDPGVQVLAIIAAVVMAAGIATPLIPRLRTRLFGAAGVAFLAGVLVVVTQLVAQSNLTSQLQEDAESLGDDQSGVPDINAVADEMIHTEVGFWLALVGLVLLALVNVGVVYQDKIMPKPALAGAGTAPPPYGATTAGATQPAGTVPADAPPAEPPPVVPPTADVPTADAPPTDKPAEAPIEAPAADSEGNDPKRDQNSG